MSFLAGIVHTGISATQTEKDTFCLQEMASLLQKASSPAAAPYISADENNGTAFLFPPGRKNILPEELPYTILLDGYILNKKELAELLSGKGIHLTGNSDEELLARLFREYGTRMWEKLSGSFAIAVFDRENRKLYLIRDRLGSRALFYFCTPEVTVFAGSMGALKKHCSFPGDFEEQSLWDFLSLQYVPEGTIYRNVRKLLPGSFAEISFADRCFSVTKKYWKADFSVKETFSYSDACRCLRELLFSSVEKHLSTMPEDAEKGIFLSGGVDSCIIGGICAKLYKGDLNVFSMGFDEAIYDEREQAEINFRHIKNLASGKMKHFVSPVPADTLPTLLQLAEDYGSPYADASLLPTSLLCAFAKENNTSFAFCGDGADELFGGYERYLAMRYLYKCDILPALLRDRFALLLLSLLPESSERGLPARAKRFLQAMRMSGKERYFSMITHVKEEDKKRVEGRLLKEATLQPTLENFDRFGLLTQGTSREKSEWCSEFDLANYLANDCLVKMELASSNAFLDVRSPFLQNDIVDFAMKLPYSFKEKGGIRKKILCDAFADLMPKGLARRKKRGFGVPVAAFLRKEWKECTEKILLQGDLVKRGFFDENGIKSLLQEHCSAKRDHSYLLLSLMMAEESLKKKER